MPETGPMLIDNVEQEILRVNRDVIRTTIAAYLEELSKKARNAGGVDGCVITTNAHPYAVDGEIGRFTFHTHTVVDATGRAWNTATQIFAALGPREWYRTAGFRELLLKTVTQMAYRPAVALLNRIRHEDVNAGTPVRTAAEVVEREGTAMQTTLGQWADDVLSAHGFTPEGQPQDPTEFHGVSMEAVRLPQSTVDEAVTRYNRDKAETFRIDSAGAMAFYENTKRTVNVSIDDVGVKKQKMTGRRTDSPSKNGREYVHNTIAHVEAPQGRYVLNGLGTYAVLRLLVAFLLHQQVLSDHYVQFFVDGARSPPCGDPHAVVPLASLPDSLGLVPPRTKM